MISMPEKEYRELKRRYGDRRMINWPLIVGTAALAALWSLLIWSLL